MATHVSHYGPFAMQVSFVRMNEDTFSYAGSSLVESMAFLDLTTRMAGQRRVGLTRTGRTGGRGSMRARTLTHVLRGFWGCLKGAWRTSNASAKGRRPSRTGSSHTLGHSSNIHGLTFLAQADRGLLSGRGDDEGDVHVADEGEEGEGGLWNPTVSFSLPTPESRVPTDCPSLLFPSLSVFPSGKATKEGQNGEKGEEKGVEKRRNYNETPQKFSLLLPSPKWGCVFVLQGRPGGDEILLFFNLVTLCSIRQSVSFFSSSALSRTD